MYFEFWERVLQGIPSRKGTLESDHFPANGNIGIHFPPWGCASHKNWTSVHQLPLQNHCFIGSGDGSWCWSGCCGSNFCGKHNKRAPEYRIHNVYPLWI